MGRGRALGAAGRKLELFIWDQQADCVGAACDLPACKAMAEDLLEISVIARNEGEARCWYGLTFMAGSPEYSYVTLPHRQLPLDILKWRVIFDELVLKIETLEGEKLSGQERYL